MTATTVLGSGIIGALLGPGLRAVIFRYSDPVRAALRRCCPACGDEILPHRPPRCHVPMLLPCSGRCPTCRDRIGPPPGSIEITTGAIFAVLALQVTSLPLLTGLCWLAACGIALAVTDAATHRLPNALVGAALLGLLSALTVTALANHQPGNLIRAVLGGLTLLVGYTTLAVLSEGMGLGDSKLAAVLGTALGWFSWTTLFVGTLLAFLVAALYLPATHVRRNRPGSGDLAFGPALLVGAFTAILISL